MDLLKKNGLFFGISVCYTSANIPSVTSREFLDLMVEKGAFFALYFNYMPVGKDAVVDLIPTPEQRVYMYDWLRRVRNSKTGKPMFIMDFQNDGEYVGGCIAGGRNYIHINSEGDMEPCVFIHYSDSNIRTHTILEGLKNPLFQAFWHNQPFNDNHLRPCPMLENPQCLRKMIAETGAKSTDLIEPESAEMLCSKCDKFANAWAPVADELWNSRKHPNPKTQYYRDTPEGRAEKQ
jgi:MoaA/NifB/PqqE/SkfB family radical SAM enzyme